MSALDVRPPEWLDDAPWPGAAAEPANDPLAEREARDIAAERTTEIFAEHDRQRAESRETKQRDVDLRTAKGMRFRDLVDGYLHTDLGNSERLVDRHSRAIRYVPTWEKWLSWDGMRWAPDAGGVIRAAKETVRAFRRAALEKPDGHDGREVANKWALESEKRARIEAMIALARSELAVAVAHTELDSNPWALNVTNGTLDLRTGELEPHRPEDLITKLAPVKFDPSAACPTFDKFMSEITLGDADLIEFHRRFLGYCLTGLTREHVVAFWWGKGGNGKSVLAELIMGMLGEYAGKTAPDLLFRTERTERHPTELMDLYGLRFAISNETKKGRAWDEGRLKELSGGDSIKARRMREDFWSFQPTHKLTVFGNNRPTLNTCDNGIRRRLRLVPFLANFVGKEDRQLDEKLRMEAPGILNWLVAGCLAWQRSGLPDGQVVSAATDEYLRAEDVLGQFFDEVCLFEPDARITRKTLRDAYQSWCRERDTKPVDSKTFTDAVRDRGANDKRVRETGKSQDGWAGVRVCTEIERETPQRVSVL